TVPDRVLPLWGSCASRRWGRGRQDTGRPACRSRTGPLVQFFTRSLCLADRGDDDGRGDIDHSPGRCPRRAGRRGSGRGTCAILNKPAPGHITGGGCRARSIASAAVPRRRGVKAPVVAGVREDTVGPQPRILVRHGAWTRRVPG